MISAEELSSGLLEPPYAAALAAAAARHFEPHLIVFLRRQDHLKESAFAEIVKDWYAGDIRDDDHYDYDHAGRVAALAAAFGPGRVQVALYRDPGPNDIVGDLLAADRHGGRPRRASGRWRRRNVSMHRRKTLFLAGMPKPAGATVDSARPGGAALRRPGGGGHSTPSPTTGCASSCRRVDRHALVAAHLDGNRALVDRLGLADPGPFLELPDPDAPWSPPAPITAREVAAVRRAALAACLRGRNPVAAARLAGVRTSNGQNRTLSERSVNWLRRPGARSWWRGADESRPVRSQARPPEIVAGEIDVLPAERREVGEQPSGTISPRRAAASRARAEIDGVPQRDGRGDQGEAAGACCCASAPRSRRRPRRWKQTARASALRASPLFSSAVACRRSCGHLQPVEREQGALDAADLAQRQREAVLPRIGAEAPQHQGRADHAGARPRPRAAAGRPSGSRSGRSSDPAGDERRERRPSRRGAEGVEPALGEVRDARREAEAEQVREPKRGRSRHRRPYGERAM